MFDKFLIIIYDKFKNYLMLNAKLSKNLRISFIQFFFDLSIHILFSVELMAKCHSLVES